MSPKDECNLKSILSRLQLRLETDRLILEPLTEHHATDMVVLLADTNLHMGMNQTEFIGKADHFKGSDSDEFVFAIKRSDWLRNICDNN